MATYNHAFSVSFALPKSEHADPHEAWEKEKEKVIYALLARISELIRDEGEYLATCDPYDTFEE